MRVIVTTGNTLCLTSQVLYDASYRVIPRYVTLTVENPLKIKKRRLKSDATDLVLYDARRIKINWNFPLYDNHKTTTVCKHVHTVNFTVSECDTQRKSSNYVISRVTVSKVT